MIKWLKILKMHRNTIHNYLIYLYLLTFFCLILIQRLDVLAEIWRRMLRYIKYISFIKKVELKWSGYSTGVPLKLDSQTYEHELSNLERNALSSLLCGIKMAAESHNVHLSDVVFDVISSERNQRVYVRSVSEADLTSYVILNNFKHFLDFIDSFLRSCLV